MTTMRRNSGPVCVQEVFSTRLDYLRYATSQCDIGKYSLYRKTLNQIGTDVQVLGVFVTLTVVYPIRSAFVIVGS